MGRLVKHLDGEHEQKDHGVWAGKTRDEVAAMLSGYPQIDLSEVDLYDTFYNMSVKEYIEEYMEDEFAEAVEFARSEWQDQNPDAVIGKAEWELEGMAKDALEETAQEILDERRNEIEYSLIEEATELYSVSGTGPNGEEWETEVSSVSVWGGEVRVDGRFTVDGEYAGQFERTISEGEAYRALLTIDDDYSGMGIASQFNHHEEMAYLKSGIPQVRISAEDLSEGDPDKPPGTYVWGSQGYDWARGAPSSVKNAVTAYIDNNPEFRGLPRSVAATVQDVADRFSLSEDSEDYPTPRELTQLGRIPGDDWWAGKSIMAHGGVSFDEAQTGQHRGPGWTAIKRLDRPEGLRVSLGEIRSKKARDESSKAVEQHVAAWRQSNPQLDFGDEFITVNGQPVPVAPTDAQILQMIGL